MTIVKGGKRMSGLIMCAEIDIKEKWRHRAGRLENDTILFMTDGEMKVTSSVGALTVPPYASVLLKAGERIRTASSGECGATWYLIEFESDISNLPYGKLVGGLGRLGAELAEKLCDNNCDEAYLTAFLTLIKEKGLERAAAKTEETKLFLPCETERGYSELQRAPMTLPSDLPIRLKVAGKRFELADERIARIRFLLEYSDYNISELARLSGFDKPNSFTRFYAYHTGEAPSDYRRRLAGIAPVHKKRK